MASYKVLVSVQAETDDSQTAVDLVEALERVVPYIFDNAVVLSTVKEF